MVRVTSVRRGMLIGTKSSVVSSERWGTHSMSSVLFFLPIYIMTSPSHLRFCYINILRTNGRRSCRKSREQHRTLDFLLHGIVLRVLGSWVV